MWIKKPGIGVFQASLEREKDGLIFTSRCTCWNSGSCRTHGNEDAYRDQVSFRKTSTRPLFLGYARKQHTGQRSHPPCSCRLRACGMQEQDKNFRTNGIPQDRLPTVRLFLFCNSNTALLPLWSPPTFFTLLSKKEQGKN
jgi:hypothetical protein